MLCAANTGSKIYCGKVVVTMADGSQVTAGLN
jgi:hypothetical protein